MKSIIGILKKHKIKKASIFGSFAKGTNKKNCDLDILVDFRGTLLEFIALKNEIEKKLGKKIDLVTYKSLHPLLKKEILLTKKDIL